MNSESLWLVKGTSPCPWSIPFYVHFDPAGANVTLYNACALRYKERVAVEELFSPFAAKVLDEWRMSRADLDRIAKPVGPVDNPESLMTWNPFSPKSVTVGDPPAANKEREEFVSFLFQTGLFQSQEQAAILYHQVCTAMLDWLVNRERPLDMYFLRLHNCPYRANWKHVLLTRFPRLGRLLCHKDEECQDVVANESGLTEEMRCLDLLAVPYSHETIRRTIELELRKLWHTTVIKAERNRLKKLGRVGYGKYVLESIARFSDAARACYVGWLNLVARPSAAGVECGPDGQIRLVPNLPPADVLQRPRQGLPVPLVVLNHQPKFVEASQPADCFPKNGTLPDEVPPVRPDHADLRERRPDLRQRAHQPLTRSGVLVLSSAEDPHAVQLLGSDPRFP